MPPVSPGSFSPQAFSLPRRRAPETIKLQGPAPAGFRGSAERHQGLGSIAATFDTATKVLRLERHLFGLERPAAMAHFHGPADPGVNAGVVCR